MGTKGFGAEGLAVGVWGVLIQIAVAARFMQASHVPCRQDYVTGNMMLKCCYIQQMSFFSVQEYRMPGVLLVCEHWTCS